MTLIQGAGVPSGPSRIVTYSRPCRAKAAEAVEEFERRAWRRRFRPALAVTRQGGGAVGGLKSRARLICSARLPRPPEAPPGRPSAAGHAPRSRPGRRARRIRRRAHRRPSIWAWSDSCEPAYPVNSANPARRTARVRSGSRDRRRAASAANIHGRAAIGGRFRDPRLPRPGPGRSAGRPISLRPERGRLSRAALEDLGRRPQCRVGIQHVIGEALEQMRFARRRSRDDEAASAPGSRPAWSHARTPSRHDACRRDRAPPRAMAPPSSRTRCARWRRAGSARGGAG